MHCSPVTEFVQGMACIPQESGDFINCSPFFGALDCGGLAPRFSSRSTAHIFLKNRGNRRNREANTARYWRELIRGTMIRVVCKSSASDCSDHQPIRHESVQRSGSRPKLLEPLDDPKKKRSVDSGRSRVENCC